MTELRAVDLRFSTAEVAAFLSRVMGLQLSGEDVAALEARTGGWIAGLQLVCHALQGHADAAGQIKTLTGSHRYILDYLVAEVLERQPASVQDFLLQTSLLDRLTGSLCEAVTGGDSGQATVESLERANLFIVPLDQERRWYRYHQLFPDLLRRRLRQSGPEQVPVLHARASAWYRRNGFIDDAIEQALHARDYEQAVSLIQEWAGALWQSGQHALLRRWLEGLPAGLTNRQIASRLFLSVHTVKSHTRNIYGKLGVHSRTPAVARGQETGFLTLNRT